METKRIPFSLEEQNILIELISGKRDVLESKASDMHTLTKKRKAWEDLTEEFNAQSICSKRTTAQLKKRWENLKALRKKELAGEMRKRMATGGGKPNKDVAIEERPAIDSIVPHIVHHVENAWDSNSLVMPGDSETPYIMQETPIIELDNAEDSSSAIWEGSDDIQRAEVVVTERTEKKQKRKTGREDLLEEEVRLRSERVKCSIENDAKIYNVKMEESQVLAEWHKQEIEMEIAIKKEKLRHMKAINGMEEKLKEEEMERKKKEAEIKKNFMQKEFEMRIKSFEAEERRRDEIHKIKIVQLNKNSNL